MIVRSINHLKDVHQSYWKHGSFAVRWGFYIIFLGIASIIHGFVPALFPFLTPDGIKKISKMIDEMEANRPKSKQS
ncbi:MAG: hypothetical protein KDD33_03150 [Bdellovibrionales bacterium]|nr:hypothetical protein [Bdellovibrionales bacterium]